MEEKNMGAKKTILSVVLVLVSIVFLFVGSILLFIGNSFMSMKNEYKNTVTGIIKSFDKDVREEYDGTVVTTYSMTVSYKVDGQEYISRLGEYRKSMEVGDEIVIYYNEPGDTVISDGLGNAGKILAIVGGGLDLAAVIMIVIVVVINKKPTQTKAGVGIY